MKITICLVFGLPGVGKSTICRCLLDNSTTTVGAENAGWKSFHKYLFSFDILMPGDIIFDEKVDDNSRTAVNKDGGKGVTQDSTRPVVASGLWKQHRERVIQLIESSIKKLSYPSNPSDHDENVAFDSASKEIVESIKTTSLAAPVTGDMYSCFQNGADSSGCDDNNKDSSTNHHVFFIDDNLFYRSMRYRFYQMARRYSCSFCQVYIHAPIDTVIGRNDGRPENSIIPHATILKMDKLFEVPDHQEYPWERNTLLLNNTNELQGSSCDASFEVFNRQRIIDDIIAFVVESSKEIVYPLLNDEEIEKRELSRLANLENYVHQCDQLLRRLISTKMQAAKSASAQSSQTLMLGSDCTDKGIDGVDKGVSNKGGGGSDSAIKRDDNRGGSNKAELKALAKHLNDSRKRYLEQLRTNSTSGRSSASHDSSYETDDDYHWPEREISKFEKFLADDNLSLNT